MAVFRYIGFFWDEADPAASATATRFLSQCGLDWRTVVDQKGFAVRIAGASESQSFLTCGSGVILGRLFAGSSRCDVLSEAEAARISSSRGRALVENYWGTYVALMRDTEDCTPWVLRGPATTLPCLHTAIGGVHVYFSWMEAAARLGGTSFSINWHQLARTLVGPLVSTQTGLSEVREILPGYRDDVHGGHCIQHCCWNPIDIAQTNPINSFSTAARTLNEVTRSCVSAWAQTTPRILHTLSGGLDSSIVLGCLRHAPTHPEITCLTHFAVGPDSDEREFARLAARAANCRQIEHVHVGDVDLQGALHGARFESTPGLRIPEVDRIEPNAAIEADADAVYKGHGGDELFCRHSPYYVADFLRAHGLRAELRKLILHCAVIEGESVWSIFSKGVRDAFIPRRWNLTEIFSRQESSQSLIDPQVLRAVVADRSFDFPPVRSTWACSPGKLYQISLINGRRFHYLPSMRDGDPETISPLLSQPIVEVCLRMPTWLQVEGRRERAVARAAFTQEVPQPILERRWKGGAEHIAWKTMRRNLPFIREVLLDGLLARERIINRPRLESLLSGSAASAVTATVPVFDLIGAEAWLQAWAGRGLRSAS